MLQKFVGSFDYIFDAGEFSCSYFYDITHRIMIPSNPNDSMGYYSYKILCFDYDTDVETNVAYARGSVKLGVSSHVLANNDVLLVDVQNERGLINCCAAFNP